MATSRIDIFVCCSCLCYFAGGVHQLAMDILPPDDPVQSDLFFIMLVTYGCIILCNGGPAIFMMVLLLSALVVVGCKKVCSDALPLSLSSLCCMRQWSEAGSFGHVEPTT